MGFEDFFLNFTAFSRFFKFFFWFKFFFIQFYLFSSQPEKSIFSKFGGAHLQLGNFLIILKI